MLPRIPLILFQASCYIFLIKIQPKPYTTSFRQPGFVCWKVPAEYNLIWFKNCALNKVHKICLQFISDQRKLNQCIPISRAECDDPLHREIYPRVSTVRGESLVLGILCGRMCD